MVWKAMITPRSPASAHWSVMAAFAAKTAETISGFASVVHNLMMDVRDSYRPELHYMRGPGPKWLAKHQRGIKFNSESGGQHHSSPVSMLCRNAANPTP